MSHFTKYQLSFWNCSKQIGICHTRPRMHGIRSVGRALDCRARGRGYFDWCGFHATHACYSCYACYPPKKALFDVFSLLGDVVIAYRTNLVVIAPKAFRTFHDQCGVHIRVFAMFTGTFRVKGGGRFRATTFCFLTIIFSVVSIPGAGPGLAQGLKITEKWKYCLCPANG